MKPWNWIDGILLIPNLTILTRKDMEGLIHHEIDVEHGSVIHPFIKENKLVLADVSRMDSLANSS
ncbi:hypothetical protein [Paenibacillus agricola]|uniref:Uncharacterized protein n=1 Tax=Paenibacillus agricola TaxID=2716264 RepID=A0ABX0JKZ1_9BACL|nr:hypothetical protein [Paenibacillus agricola]NHN34635.1 hypothetical protein [Paenibacillus agricola]